MSFTESQLRLGIALPGSLEIPAEGILTGNRVIAQSAEMSVLIRPACRELRVGVALLRSLEIPPGSDQLAPIPEACAAYLAQRKLRLDLALLACSQAPAKSGCPILGNTDAHSIGMTQRILRFGVTRVRRHFNDWEGPFIIAIAIRGCRYRFLQHRPGFTCLLLGAGGS